MNRRALLNGTAFAPVEITTSIPNVSTSTRMTGQPQEIPTFRTVKRTTRVLPHFAKAAQTAVKADWRLVHPGYPP